MLKKLFGSMKRIVILLMVVVTFFIVMFYVVFVLLVPDLMEKYTCYDIAGCWDYSANKCRKNEPNAKELCEQSRISE